MEGRMLPDSRKLQASGKSAVFVRSLRALAGTAYKSEKWYKNKRLIIRKDRKSVV